jgi:glycosyltransferase involved in cell wall biosynthesis
MLDQITPLILTYNEAPNIARTLRQLTWATEIVLVDSFSEDETVEIASSFPQVRIFQRRFDTHRNQWTFGLTDTGIETPWVLALDADYLLTDELIAELELLRPLAAVNGYTARFIYCVKGKALRSGIYPPVTVLYRREAASYDQDGHTHRVRIAGVINDLQSKIVHDDRKPITSWFNSQARYTKLEAEKLLTTERQDLSWPDWMRRLCIVAPPLMLIYCLFVRGGILDGWAGFHYAFERTIAELMLSLHLIQHRLGVRALADTRMVEKPEPQTAETTPKFKIQSS